MENPGFSGRWAARAPGQLGYYAGLLPEARGPEAFLSAPPGVRRCTGQWSATLLARAGLAAAFESWGLAGVKRYRSLRGLAGIKRFRSLRGLAGIKWLRNLRGLAGIKWFRSLRGLGTVPPVRNHKASIMVSGKP